MFSGWSHHGHVSTISTRCFGPSVNLCFLVRALCFSFLGRMWEKFEYANSPQLTCGRCAKPAATLPHNWKRAPEVAQSWPPPGTASLSPLCCPACNWCPSVSSCPLYRPFTYLPQPEWCFGTCSLQGCCFTWVSELFIATMSPWPSTLSQPLDPGSLS
jgi:hypothetical protein